MALGTPADGAGKMEQPGLDEQSAIRNRQSEMGNMDAVPLSMLSMPDDQEQMQPPEVGDVVNYQVTGKVVAIEGNYAEIQRQSINGQELQDDDNETNSDNDNPQNANQSADGDDGQALRGQAAGIGMLT